MDVRRQRVVRVDRKRGRRAALTVRRMKRARRESELQNIQKVREDAA